MKAFINSTSKIMLGFLAVAGLLFDFYLILLGITMLIITHSIAILGLLIMAIIVLVVLILSFDYIDYICDTIFPIGNDLDLLKLKSTGGPSFEYDVSDTMNSFFAFLMDEKEEAAMISLINMKSSGFIEALALFPDFKKSEILMYIAAYNDIRDWYLFQLDV